MSSILFTGAFRFPEGDAAALRINNMIKILSPRFDNIIVAGWESESQNLIDGEYYIYNNIKCYPQAELDKKIKKVHERIYSFIFKGMRTLSWIEEYISKNKLDVIVVYNPPAFFASKLNEFCKKNKIKLVLDSTEWYESDHLQMGRFGLPALENYLRMNVIYPKFTNIISISSFLDNYYLSQDVKNRFLLPILVDGCSKFKKPEIKNQINFIYAGNLGKKDNIIQFIKFLPELNSALNYSVFFNIAGVNSVELEKLLGVNDYKKIKNYVKCHGRINRNAVLDLYKISHFSILFRDNLRYAKAGFPTKLVESWSNSTPVICNSVGDIALYAKHGENACVVESMNDVVVFLVNLLKNDMYSHMQGQCENTIEKHLSNSKFEHGLINFFNDLKF
ncbi:MAG: glycosyltransferase [Acinetobacter sp.]